VSGRAAVEFDWDKKNAGANLRKHGIAFERVREFEFDTAVIRSVDIEDDEERIVALGFVGERLHVLVYTEREDSVRVISLRLANKSESREFYGRL
jgi:uncharacterized protein